MALDGTMQYPYPRKRPDALVITYSTTMAIAILLVTARLYVRIAMLKRLWWDDYLIVFSMVSIPRNAAAGNPPS